MEHRRIGQLSASVVGMGCNQLGTACDQALTAQIVGEALDAGVNYFDTADEYGRDYSDPNDVDGWGLSEEYLGRALKHHRDEAVIASKFGIPPPGDSSGGGGGAQWIGIAVEASLRRLGTDHIDLYQLHVPDPSVPIGETLEALNGLVRSGKIREIGCCNLSGVELEEAATVAEQAGLAPFASVQSPLNVIQRATLDDVMPACERLGMAFIPYYPLASGMLTGKYRRGERPMRGNPPHRPTGRRSPSPAFLRPDLRPPRGPRGLRPGPRPHPARTGFRLAARFPARVGGDRGCRQDRSGVGQRRGIGVAAQRRRARRGDPSGAASRRLLNVQSVPDPARPEAGDSCHDGRRGP